MYMYIWTIFLRPIQSGQNKTNHYPDVNAISNESPSQEMAEVTHSSHLSLESLKKATSSHGTLEKGTTKNIIGESLQHPPPKKKHIPQDILIVQGFATWQLSKVHPVDNSADEVIFRNFHLMNFFNITTSLLSLILCNRWECVVMSLTGDSLMMDTCPNQNFLTLDSPPEEGEYNWSYLLICENQCRVSKV